MRTGGCRCLGVVALSLLLGAQSAVASRLTGRVFVLEDGERKPADGAWVRASAGTPPQTVVSAPTLPDGSYRLERLPAGRVSFVRACAGKLVRLDFGDPAIRARYARFGKEIEVRPGETVSVDLRLIR